MDCNSWLGKFASAMAADTKVGILYDTQTMVAGNSLHFSASIPRPGSTHACSISLSPIYRAHHQG